LAEVLVTGSVALAGIWGLLIGWSVYSERKRLRSGISEADDRVPLRYGIAGLVIGVAICFWVVYRETGSWQFATVTTGFGAAVVVVSLALMTRFGLGPWGDR